ncbi:MAG: nitrilase family protein [Bacteroidales bacterium]|nr:nitrilase family protein [Bacteroidales bacterium]
MIQPQLTIAYYQQDIAWELPEKNYRMVEEAFASLEGKVDVIVVPETFNTGFSDNMAAMAEEQEGATLQFARHMARQHDALFVGTWTVRLLKGEVVNRLHWVCPDGRFGCYDKGHTFRMSSEASQLKRGSHRELFEWRGWRIKPAVCYDLRFPKWLRNGVPEGERYKLPKNGVERPSEDVSLEYDLLLVCANWPGSRHEAWSTLLKARAIENLCYVVGVNRAGVDGVGIPYTGNSAAIDYKGMELSHCEPERAEVQLATLDYGQLQTFRRHWPFYLDFD